MTKARYWVAMISFACLIFSGATADSQENEKIQLRNSFFGEYEKATVIKKKGKSELQVWGRTFNIARHCHP